MMPLIQDRLAELDGLMLDKGGHRSRNDGVCATEAIAWLAGEEHSDHPECLSPILGAFLRGWNDAVDKDQRQELKPYLPRCIGTADDGNDELRGWMAADWLVRTYTPAWLELAGIKDSAAALRSLPPLRDLGSTKRARKVIDVAREEAAAARDAARDAAWDAAGDAAWAAAVKALEPTRAELKASAHALLDAMIMDRANTTPAA